MPQILALARTALFTAIVPGVVADYALAVAENGGVPLPVILTFSPCGSVKTLSFIKWLGVAFPRWLENELQFARDPLAKSLELCERIFAEVRIMPATKAFRLV